MTQYIVDEPALKMRVLLVSNGSARVDLNYDRVGAPGPDAASSVFLPVSAEEVQRIIQVVAALDDAGVVADSRQLLSLRGTVAFKCVKGGRTHEIRINSGQMFTNLLWRGLRDEFDAIAMVGLAKAAYQKNRAEQFAERKEYGPAVDYFWSADKQCDEAMGNWFFRYGGIWEFVFPKTYTVSNRTYEISGVPHPDSIGKNEPLTMEEKINIYRQVWGQLTKDCLVVSQFKGGPLLLDFTPGQLMPHPTIARRSLSQSDIEALNELKE